LTQFSPGKYSAWCDLLSRVGLQPDENFDQTVLLWEGDTLAAAGSRWGNLLKCIAVDPAFRGIDLTATLLTALRQEAFRAGQKHLFLYTKPENRFLFSQLLFHPVVKTRDVLLMESVRGGIREFLKSLPRSPASGPVGAAGMHCDPFTLGHRHLIETAAKECSQVYVFVLSEDRGFFSAEDRMEMVRRGTADLRNVTVLPTGPYLISAATFPTYFLKDRDGGQAQCALDIALFTQYFVPHFGITRRYVGTEPFSALTDDYNRNLAQQLPAHGITLVQVPRMEQDGCAVSASRVRRLLQEGNLAQV
jgi:[citrate (pro-3S)-lyase] ligase